MATRLFITIFSTMAVLLLACTQHSATDERLSSVEAMMHDHPDSALAILEKFPHDSLFTDEQRALHALLLTQARDKNYYYETNDSMISIALSYYGDSNDDYHKMLAFFYMGCIKFYCNDLSLSIINYTKAEKIAKKINDWFYLGMIYQGMSYVYSNVYNSTEQLSYAELSYDAFKKYDDVSYTMYALKDLSMAYNNTMEYEKAVNIAKQVIDSAIKMQDSTLLIESLRIAATSSYAQKKSREALSFYSKLQEVGGNNSLHLRDIQNMAESYAQIGDNHKSDSIMQYCLDYNFISEEIPPIIYEMRGDYKSAYYSLEKESELQDSIIWGLVCQKVTKAVADYNKQEQQAKDEMIRLERTIFVFIVIVMVIMIVVAVYIAKIKFKLQKKKEENVILAVQNLSEEIKLKEVQNSEIRSSMFKLLTKQFESIEELCLIYYECKDTPKEQKKIYDRVKCLINNLSKDAKTIKELEENVNMYADGLMSKFRNQFPELKESDCMLYLYSIAGFSARAISILIDEKIEVVYNRKSRLKTKIKNSKSVNKTLFLNYLG